MKSCFYMLSSLIAVVTPLFVACGNGKLSNPESIPADDPAQVVEQLLTSMAAGKIDDSKIIYSDDLILLPVIHHRSRTFHDVKFKIEEIRLSPFDTNTQTVKYSCIVPHPGVSFWQWKPIDASELQNVPRGIPMSGQFTLIQEGDAGWRVRVEDETNPIILYKRVVSSVNRTWYSFIEPEMEGRKVPGDVIRYNLFMHVAEYSICLGIPEKNAPEFEKRVATEAIRIGPR
jgi:hypothetical protein